MKIGLLLNSNRRLCPYSEKYREILTRNSIHFITIDPNSDTLLDELNGCSHLLFRHSMGDTDFSIFDTIFNIAHNVYLIKCYPNFETYWPHENKIKEYFLLKSNNFPIIDSRVFWNYEMANAFINSTQFPVVAKLPKGASSSNVVIVNSIDDGKKIINQIFNKGADAKGLRVRSSLSSLSKMGIYKYTRAWLRVQLINLGLLRDKTEYPEWQIQKDSIIFQKYLANNSFDTRVTVIGNRAFAFRRFVRKNDFRASGSGNFDMDKDLIDSRCIEIAFKISKKLNFNTMAYDFLYDENRNPWINEISYGFIDWVVQQCPGYWDEKLDWHSGNFSPQQCQLEDFLEIKLVD
jgi:glutathione synthase/RimK-type ligase-like ATP-grasp enzyme